MQDLTYSPKKDGVQTRDGVWRQFPSGQHDVSEVEGGVVNAAELHVGTRSNKMTQRGSDPAQR